MAAWPARIAFVIIFMVATLPAWAITVVTDAYYSCVQFTAEKRRRRGRFMAWLVSLSWQLAFHLCCWIHMEASGLKDLKYAGKSGRPVFLAANHASRLDPAIICSSLPSNLVGDTKTLMANGAFKLPVLGRLAQAVGHLPVPFLSSSTRGNFSVDKRKLAGSMALLDQHVSAGGHLIIFPEGDLNKAWWTLLPFRAGGIELCVRHDMEVWGWVTMGTGECWPVEAAVGGNPVLLRSRAVLLYPSARKAAQQLSGPDADLRAQAVALANDMRSKMQGLLDEMLDVEGD